MSANVAEYKRVAAQDFPEFGPQEVDTFIEQFNSFDLNGDGDIDGDELKQVLDNLKMPTGNISALIDEVDLDKSGTVQFNEFLFLIRKLRAGEVDGGSGFADVYQKKAKQIIVEGSSAGIQHSFSEEEKVAFVEHVNLCLRDDEDVKDRLPVSEEGLALFDACKDGVLLCKLINDAVPDTIDMRVVNLKPKNAFHITENNNIVINSAKAIGCNVVNIGAQDIAEGKIHLLLGMIWQVVKIGLLAKISLTNCPELFRLLEEGEELSDLLKLSPEEILLRWFNYHLKAADHPRRVKNFSGDIKDSENYTVLLHQLKPEQCALSPMQEPDLRKRAELMLQQADNIGCRKYVTPTNVAKGNPKLNLAFVANLFNTHPCLEPLSEEERAALEEWLFASEGTREARAFCLWINSLGVEPFVNNLFENLKDGLVVLKTMDIVSPGIVDWKKVNQKTPLNTWKKVENCNYAIVLAKQLKFSLVGIGGKDIADGNQTLTLALVWQLMRFHIIKTLQSLSEDGKALTDPQIVAWANDKVKASGKDTSMTNFKDQTLKTGKFLIDLLEAVKPKTVNYDLVTEGADEEDQMMNAKYAISIARKLGACIFVLPEDIVEVKSKMIMTFVGSVMAVAKGGAH
eukprot:TRINITY_DN23769_c0_g1_i1.p1 TRINITY_DN23769_c0_g1~~TRINITY_DN23769_c0_g1_i1.p1  ORF type:complete len:627 (-),score=275.41 TRINITY_DN23769_c0_g1_i1:273-2153(-)